MNDLTKQWNELFLSSREWPKFRLQKDLATAEYIIAAKFLIKRDLNIDAIAATFKMLWRSKNGFKVKNLGNHIVLLTVDNKLDVDIILSNEPWSFNKNLYGASVNTSFYIPYNSGPHSPMIVVL